MSLHAGTDLGIERCARADRGKADAETLPIFGSHVGGAPNQIGKIIP